MNLRSPFRDEQGDIVLVDIVLCQLKSSSVTALSSASSRTADRLHADALAAEVQIKLKVLDAPVLPHHMEDLGDDDEFGDLEISVTAWIPLKLAGAWRYFDSCPLG